MLDVPRRSPTEAPGAGTAAQVGAGAAGWAARNRKRLIGIAILCCAVALAGAAAWKVYLRPLPVQVAGQAADVPVEVFGLGTIEARVASQVGFKVAGLLLELRADVGDRVRKGDVLAKLDDREQAAQLRRARAAVEQAQASLLRATASVSKAQANYANATSINARRQKLVETNIASVETAQSSKAAQDVAMADLNLADSDVAVAQAGLSDASAQLALQTATLDFHSLTAPYDAVITARLKELGSSLAAGQAVFSLIDPQSVWVLAYIDESKAGEVRVGEPAELVLRSRPGQRLRGKVARIQPESDRVNEERRVEVAFEAIPAEANLGEQAEVYITTLRLSKPLLVPEAAVVGATRTEGTVWTVESGRLAQRKVKLGHRLLDGRYEITAGVPDGAQVVTALVGGLRSGRAATVSGGPPP